MKRMLMVLGFAAALLGGAATVRAEAAANAGNEGAAASDTVVYKKKTVIDLTGAVIEGELTKPEGSYVVVRKASRFSQLIRLRQDFIPELLASPDQL